MRKISMIVLTASAIGVGLGSASAGSMMAPAIPDAGSALSVSYVEMTVANKYGYANLRQRPSKHGKLLDKLPEGTKVVVVGTLSGGTWVHVQVGNKQGYILANLLKAEPVSQQPSAAAAAAASAQPDVQLVSSVDQYRDGTYSGKIADAYYGLVQVEADIQGGRLVAVQVLQYPADRSTSRYINSRALPMLESEVVSAQSAQVDMVSGATLTSTAYLRSLNSALARAHP